MKMNVLCLYLDFLIISIFLLGAVIGLLSIVRVIKLLYERQKDLLLAIFFLLFSLLDPCRLDVHPNV